MTTNLTRPVRVPVGSCVAVAPPGAGKTTVLRAALLAAGLPTDRIVSRDELRARFAADCTQFACKMVPMSCMHFEDKVTELANAKVNSHLIAGETWFYDQTGCNADRLRDEVDRAHRAGLAAVALRVTDSGGDLPLEVCLDRNAARSRQVPVAVVASMHARYTELTAEALYELGFDVVIDWDENTTFQLMPEACDARNIDTPLVVVGDLHGCSHTFFERMLPAVGLDTELTRDDVLLVGVGDINDKGGVHDGERSGAVDLIRWWMRMIRTGRALLVDSNHNKALLACLAGKREPRYGIAQTIAEIEAQPDAEALKAEILATFSRLPTHLVFPDTVVVHAAMTEELLFRNDRKTQSFAVHTRYEKKPWEWTGTQTLVHGHVVVGQPDRRRAPADPARPGHVPGEVVNVDTGAYRGQAMTCYLSATGETVSVDPDPADVIDAEAAALLHAELVELGIIEAA